MIYSEVKQHLIVLWCASLETQIYLPHIEAYNHTLSYNLLCGAVFMCFCVALETRIERFNTLPQALSSRLSSGVWE